MFFTPPQGFPVIPKCFDFELIALRTRNRDRSLAIVRSHSDFKTYRSVGRTIGDRIGLYEVPIQHRDNMDKSEVPVTVRTRTRRSAEHESQILNASQSAPGGRGFLSFGLA